MSGLVEQELLRARWRRALDAVALDRTDRDDFASRGLAARLKVVSAQLLLLPCDPEATNLVLDDALANWLQARQSTPLDRITVTLPANLRRTAHALTLADTYDQTWDSYLALHRSGAIEYGLGNRGGWDGADRERNAVRIFTLTPIVARVWAVLHLAAELAQQRELAGPYQLTVGVQSTKGALLGSLGEGWAEPGDYQNHVSPCREDHLLWHLELDTLPDQTTARDIAYSVGDRFEDAWGVPQRRYLAHRGGYENELDPRCVN
jgi:hypothetical protein